MSPLMTASAHQAGVRLCQGTLSRTEEEHASPAGDLRARQSVHGAPAAIGLPKGVVCLQPGRQPCSRPNTASTRPNRPVSYSLSKSPCLLAPVPALIQTFLSLSSFV